MNHVPVAGQTLPRPRLSIVVPAYNEERRLPPTLQTLLDPAQVPCADYELIVVDDGSRDQTASLVRAAQAGEGRLRLIENPHSGKAYTVRTGVLAASGQYCLHADVDLSTPPCEFSKLVDALDGGADIAIGVRAGRPGAPWYRLVMSNSWRWLVSLLGLGGFSDTQCGFKAFRTGVAQEVFHRTLLYNSPARSLANPSVTAAADVEVLYIARRLGYRIAEVPVAWTHAEDTKIRPLGDSVHAFSDLVKIRLNAARGLYGRPVTARDAQQVAL
jgi:dolichyl-phosphate beta-glucosyltransferase